ncbi:MAG: relaxase/mobilization nuclease domain-containing protein [Gemmatimonadales bacterium]
MIAISSSGKSFRALATYLANGRTGKEQDRVAWSVSRNLPTNDPELAATFMRATAGQSDRVEKPVYHVALSFDPGDAVDRETMERVAGRMLDRLGLGEHQAVIVAHRDRRHAHVHILVNRVHPETGKAWERWKDQPVIQQVLRDEERALGLREVVPSLELRGVPGQHAAMSRVAQLVQLLKDYERTLELTRERSGAQGALAAAQARDAEAGAGSARAQGAAAAFLRALRQVYRDPEEAQKTFTKLVESTGLDGAVSTLREYPERVGPLLSVERPRALGLVRTEDDQQARTMARSATLKGREAIEAERAARTLEAVAAGSGSKSEKMAGRVTNLNIEIGRRPGRSELEYRIGQAMERLIPREIERLKQLLTAPQLAIAQHLRAVARDVALGRE